MRWIHYPPAELCGLREVPTWEELGLGSGLASRDKRGPAPAVRGFTVLGQSAAARVCEGRWTEGPHSGNFSQIHIIGFTKRSRTEGSLTGTLTVALSFVSASHLGKVLECEPHVFLGLFHQVTEL